MKITNNIVAILIIIFIIISIICNLIVYQKTKERIQIVGKATALGEVKICINHRPKLSKFQKNVTVREGETLYLDINATDINNATQNITFSDNTTLFEIDPITGIINHTFPDKPGDDDVGVHHVLITATDSSPCLNNEDSETLILTINSKNHRPTITSYHPTTNPEIKEGENQTFNITYSDEDGDSLTIRWKVNNKVVSTFYDNNSILKSSYVFTANYTSAGIYTIYVDVSDGSLGTSHTWILNVTNVNRPPYFYRIIKNQTWAEDTTLYGLDLDDYATDPDEDDNLSYSVNYLTNPHSIVVSINSKNVVTFSQPANWYGSENISFNVIDSYGASNTSNNITLTVYDVPEVEPRITVIRYGGGGGARWECREMWVCTFWSICHPNGYMERKCIDLSDCGTNYTKPKEREKCKYIPSCFNGIKDNNEEGIDCGGPCAPCPSCFDGIINQNETGIDCGGPCELKDCCYNGYMDAHLGEEGIDCGGPCKKCEVELEKMAPRKINWIKWTKYAGISLIALTTISLLVLATKLMLIPSIIAKKHKKKKEETKIKHKKISKIIKTIISKIKHMEKVIEKESTEKALNRFLKTLKAVFIVLFGLRYEFTYEDLIPIIKESKLRQSIKNILIRYIKGIIHLVYSEHKIKKEEILVLTKELELILALISKEKISKEPKEVLKERKVETKEEQFYYELYKTLFMIQNKKTKEAEKSYSEAKRVHKKLNDDEKEKAYAYLERIGEELELFRKKEKHHREIKKITITSLVLIAIIMMTGMIRIIEPKITGLVIQRKNTAPILMEIPTYNIKVGEHFIANINAYDADGDDITFSDDTRLFNISSNGLIEFTPTHEDVGLHHVTIIAKDNQFHMDFQDVVFNITEEQQIIIEGITTNETINETTIQEQEINESTNITNTTETIENTTINNTTNETINTTNQTKALNLSTNISINETINETNPNIETNQSINGTINETTIQEQEINESTNSTNTTIPEINETIQLNNTIPTNNTEENNTTRNETQQQE